MFIHYCDGCGIRVDNDDSVAVGDKVFCKQCGEGKVAAAPKAPSGGSGFHRTGASGGSGLHSRGGRASPSHGAHGSPPSGTRIGSSPGVRVTSPRTGASQMRPAQSTVAGRPDRPDRAERAERSGSAESADNKMIWLLAGAGVLLAVAGVLLMGRGKPKVSETTPPKVQTPAKVQTPEKTNTDTSRNVVKATEPREDAPGTPPVEPVDSTRKPAVDVMDDIREGAAERELARIKELQKSSPENRFEITRRYEQFVSKFRSTRAGKEAAEALKSLGPVPARAADTAGNTKPGLTGASYEKNFADTVQGAQFGTMSKMRDVVLSTVDIPNRDAVAATFGRHDDVAVQLSGFVEVPADGEYTFYTESDDGSLLYIGDWLVLNNDGSHGMFEKGESLALKKGKHRLRLLYYQGHGDGGLKLSWSGPNVPKQIIPESALSHPE